MISQEEFRKLIIEDKWDKVSELTDDEIIELVSYGEGEDVISAEDAMIIINKARAGQQVQTKFLILKNKEVDALKRMFELYVEDEPYFEDEDICELADKIKNA